MGQGDWVELRDVRRELDKDIYDILKPLVAAGWTIRRQGHKFRIYCPCQGEGASTVRVDGSPQNPGTAARRIERHAARCPDRHDLIP